MAPSFEHRVGFGPLLANSSFMALWLSQCCSQGADRLIFILLVEIVSGLDSSARVMSMAVALPSAPNVLFGAAAGVWADRVDKRQLMIGSNLARLVLVLLLGLLGHLNVALAIGIAFLLSCAAQPFVPAEAAAMPLVVPPEHLMQANSISALTMIGALVAGFTLGEPLTHAVGIPAAAGVAAAGYLASALFMSRVRLTNVSDVASQDPRDWGQFAEGLAYLRSRGGIRRTIALQVIIFSTFAALSIVAIILAKDVLKTPFSWLLASAGAGMGAGAWVIGQWGARWNRDAAIAGGFFATAALLVLLATFGLGRATLAYALASGLGFASSVVGVPLQTRLQELVEDRMRGRVFGVQTTVLNAIAIVPLAGVGAALEVWGVRPVLLGLAVLAALAGIGAAVGRIEPPLPAR
jgi:predicted MFS family arabinose efflux permease